MRNAKAPSAGSTSATGISRGFLRRAFAARGASSETDGSGAPSASRGPKRLLAAAAVLALTLTLGVALAAATAPSVGFVAPFEVGYTTARVGGEVNPENRETSCHFEYIADAQFAENEGNSLPGFEGAEQAGCNVEPLTKIGSQLVEAQLSGLQPATEYHLRLVASNEDGEQSAVGATFTTNEVGAPVLGKTFVSTATATAATLNSAIDPVGSPTSYRFEYVTEAEFGANGFANAIKVPSPDAAIGSGPGEIPVSRNLTELAPDTSYRYRVVATNGVGTTPSVDHTFHTRGLSSPSGLPENRAYEMVSPVEKNGSDISANPWRTRAAVDGNAVSFTSPGSFSDASGAEIASEYVAKRGSEGWSTHNLSPSQPPVGSLIPNPPNKSLYVGDFSTDLTKGVLLARQPLTDAPNVQAAFNLYLRANVLTDVSPSASGNYTLLTDSVEPLTENEHVSPLGQQSSHTALSTSTPDLTHVVFESTNNLTAETSGLSPERVKTYEWTDGVLRFVGVLPDSECGSPPCPAPESLAGAGGAYLPSVSAIYQMPHIISENGDRIFFSATSGVEATGSNATGGTLYARLNHSSTIQINVSERSDCADHTPCSGTPEPDPAGPQPAVFLGASADGSKVYFLTREALTDDDNNFNVDDPGSVGGQDLYRYDFNAPAGERLTLISLNGDSDPSNGVERASGVMGISDDGSYFYFSGTAKLVPGQPDLPGGADFYLYVWHDGEIRYIGNAGRDGSDRVATAIPQQSLSIFGSRVTPDGKTLVFNTNATNPPYPNQSSTCTQGLGYRCDQVYVYRYASDQTVCASCSPTGAAPASDALIQELGDKLKLRGTTEVGHLNHALADDGSKLFFSTRNALVPEDTNGHFDAYEYVVSSETLHLLSTGECACDSFFVEATPSGDSVFIVTSQQLVRIDRDRNADMYDVRVDGGIAAQNELPPSECQGDSCLAPASAPNDATPSSVTFGGPGDPKSRAKRQHHRKKHRQKRHSHRSGHATHRHGRAR